MNVHTMHMPRSKKRSSPRLALRKTFLREHRKAHDLSLEQVGEILDERYGISISYTSLGRIERGLQPYNQRLIEALAELYDEPVSTLLNRPPKTASLDDQAAEVPGLWEEAADFISTRRKHSKMN